MESEEERIIRLMTRISFEDMMVIRHNVLLGIIHVEEMTKHTGWTLGEFLSEYFLRYSK